MFKSIKGLGSNMTDKCKEQSMKFLYFYILYFW